MATFIAGDTVTLSLDIDDTVTITGLGTATITNSNGGNFQTRMMGSAQTLGPYGQNTNIVFVATSAGTYFVGGDASRAPRCLVIAQSAIPVILPSSGTSNSTGQITLTTALPYSPASLGVVQIYLPAGVVTSGTQGSGAGLYSAIFSSTTVCQLTGTVVTGNAAYTQVVTQATLATVQVAGGLMGSNGALRPYFRYTHLNNANSKTCTLFHANQAVTTSILTTSPGGSLQGDIHNRGTQQAQITGTSFGAATGVGTTYRTNDTSITQPITFTGQLAVDTDYIILEGYTVEVLPG
jgi:hypothetical protein